MIDMQKLQQKVAESRVRYELAVNKMIPVSLDQRDEMERAKRRRSAMRAWDKLINPVLIVGPFTTNRAMRRA